MIIWDRARYCRSNSTESAQADFIQRYFARIQDLDWYIDSGATHHVTSELSNINIREDQSSAYQLFIGDGTCLPVIASGSTTLKSFVHPLLLNNILCTPKISKNLISSSKFVQDNNCLIELHSNFFVVRDQLTGQQLLQGSVKDGLYCLRSKNNVVSPQVFLTTSTSSKLWH